MGRFRIRTRPGSGNDTTISTSGGGYTIRTGRPGSGNDTEISSPDRNLRGALDQTNAERTNIGFATPESRTVSMVQRAPAPGEVGTAESVQQFQDELAQDIIDEREEMLEEFGGRSEETEILGDEADEVKQLVNSLSVVYDFSGTYTSDGFLQSFSPIFQKISKEGNRRAVRARRREMLRTKRAARDSVLIARMQFKAGRQKIDDYKALTQIAEPELNISTRAYLYSDKEQGILQDIISQSIMGKNDMLAALSNSLQIPQYEQIETAVIVNKLELESGFRLSPIEDDPISPRELPDRLRISEGEDSGEEAVATEEVGEQEATETFDESSDLSVRRRRDPNLRLPRTVDPDGPTLGGGAFRDTSLIEETDLVRRFATEAQGGSESTVGEQAPGRARGGYQSGD
jgi:hypothetical protein